MGVPFRGRIRGHKAAFTNLYLYLGKYDYGFKSTILIVIVESLQDRNRRVDILLPGFLTCYSFVQ